MNLLGSRGDRQNRRRGKLGGARNTNIRKGFVVASAEAPRFSYSELPLPKLPVDERAAEVAKGAGSTLVRLELEEDLRDNWSCFEETAANGQVTGRIWVTRQNIEEL